ncbi:OB-fold domain-containing protein [Mycobacterium sp. CVI_P3]|uniref:OB-fold domain-containing protein n=1 Tax=Mycobacterium pinniadriaticum TaxID=2994102 RepID=A0ABT3SEL0_9MYCO|nr:OB-fold domain-containing protein [Mycobacterium pinniadriaticum]MCX2931655.1 OB-fold domain-containing protein [Mycobacterium pinniadriaticum]MCX2937953.1 OB-fold domain-containing protein [Mycobacterium pinniadriaticum]
MGVGTTRLSAVGTYLPPWKPLGKPGARRVRGPDEDALTMAVAAGRAADPGQTARRVVFVSRDFPLLEGGNGAVLLAGLSLGADIPVTEVLGGGPAALDAILGSAPGTLVIAADDSRDVAGGGAVLVGADGAALVSVARQTRSLPVVVRHRDGSEYRYRDPRLQREVGTKSTLVKLGLTAGSPVAAAAGVGPGLLGPDLDADGATVEPAESASGVIHALASAIEAGAEGLVLALEQSSATVAHLSPGPTAVRRDEREGGELPAARPGDGIDIPISLAAYSRAFEPKLRWQADVYREAPGIDADPQYPPRSRVGSDGRLARPWRTEPLPRKGTVYTHTTVRIPVPGLPGPYSLALVQLDDSPVRVLLKVTGAVAGQIHIGQPGSIVLRKIATRAGVPDYGYAFLPWTAPPDGESVHVDRSEGAVL